MWGMKEKVHFNILENDRTTRFITQINDSDHSCREIVKQLVDGLRKVFYKIIHYEGGPLTNIRFN